jgi:hypothetical protein
MSVRKWLKPCNDASAGQPNRDTISVLMNSTQANSRECLQQAIDSENQIIGRIPPCVEASLECTLSPISSLPPEIFAAIFSFLCLPGIPSLGGGPDCNLAHVSHVCHQWHEIALNQPQLWSHINFNTLSLAGATETLVRAKLVPLYMEKRVSGEHDNG